MHADPAIRREDLVRRWNELANDPESPDWFELNEFGELILSPKPTSAHQIVAFEVGFQLTTQLGPRAATDISVLTDRGIRAPDVVWMPSERWAACKGQTPLQVVPDVCVEVLSPSNTRAEIAMKVGAYLRGGAREVIVVGLRGELEFFGPEGRREASGLGVVIALSEELF
jgi:Uma2 family endonuclease